MKINMGPVIGVLSVIGNIAVIDSVFQASPTGPTWEMFWKLIGGLTTLIVGVGAWAILSLINYREKTLAMVAAVGAMEKKQEERHHDNLQAMKDITTTTAEVAEAVKEITYALYGTRGRGGMIDESEYNQSIRHDFINRFQAIEMWITQMCASVEGVPLFIPLPPMRRRTDAQGSSRGYPDISDR